jgi:hypothetical protein
MSKESLMHASICTPRTASFFRLHHFAGIREHEKMMKATIAAVNR